SLSFCVSIVKGYPESSMGPIENLYDFSCLAKENWNEAFQIFYHKSFLSVFRPNEIKEKMLYRGMVSSKPSNQNMEEFLIGIGKKDKISFFIEKEKEEYLNLTESVKKSIQIRKDNWGFLEISVSVEGEFLFVDKKAISSEDFLGSVYPVEFYIDIYQMHQGKNFGKIILTSAYETIEVEIVAKMLVERGKNPKKRKKKELLAEVMQLYMDYRFNHIVTGVWAKDTIEKLKHLYRLEPEEPMYLLMQAQVFFINKQRQEAEWIISDFKHKWTGRKSQEWGYYLYLKTLLEKEPIYVERLTKEIEDIFEEHTDSVLLFGVLLFLREEYKENSALKLKAIEEWIMAGYDSPYLYLEAYYLLSKEPYLLAKNGEFEMRMLRWAFQHRVITKDIAMQIFEIIGKNKTFDKISYDILCAAYKASPEPENVGIICGYLIKGQKYETQYHSWYEKGIQLELRITGLYEAYLLSMDESKIVPVPKVIQMYFRYESKMPYKKMAVLYNNIISAKEAEPNIYEQYRKPMSKFAIEHILEGHIDDNLAVLYEDMLEETDINEAVARAMTRILFTYKLMVFDKRVVRAIIYQRTMKQPQIVAIVNQVAYFRLLSKEYVIFFEDELGQKYASVSYQLQKIIDCEKFLKKCMEIAWDENIYMLYYIEKARQENTFLKKEEDIPIDVHYLIDSCMSSEAISQEYKALLLPEIMRFYHEKGQKEKLELYLVHTDYAKLKETDRKLTTELLVKYELFESVYEKLVEYGTDGLAPMLGKDIASYMINHYNKWQEGEEDKFLTSLCLQVFRAGRYDKSILEYLGRFFQGSTKEMMKLWKVCQNYEISRVQLTEHILLQMMYTNHMVLDGLSLVSYYTTNNGKDLILQAYLADCSYRYFVQKQIVNQILFQQIEHRMMCRYECNDICKLSLLHYYSGLSQLTKTQFAIEDELLAEYTRRNMNFAFFKQLDGQLLLKYHLYDKVFLEYRTNPRSHVAVHYSRDEDGEHFRKEDMPHIYEGIFVKSFVMFFGESIQYYISEEFNNQVQMTESSRIVNNDVYNKTDGSRYSMLNEMLISNILQEDEEMQADMKRYMEFHEVTQNVFKLL
ncbi:MAG: hypothetical protein IKJ01_07145, partial [Lachnospiraceae bacterium]|nr:hypothetical protein [Lachnospiraceae bacterium]